jgi:hypothetical protein
MMARKTWSRGSPAGVPSVWCEVLATDIGSGGTGSANTYNRDDQDRLLEPTRASGAEDHRLEDLVVERGAKRGESAEADLVDEPDGVLLGPDAVGLGLGVEEADLDAVRVELGGRVSDAAEDELEVVNALAALLEASKGRRQPRRRNGSAARATYAIEPESSISRTVSKRASLSVSIAISLSMRQAEAISSTAPLCQEAGQSSV